MVREVSAFRGTECILRAPYKCRRNADAWQTSSLLRDKLGTLDAIAKYNVRPFPWENADATDWLPGRDDKRQRRFGGSIVHGKWDQEMWIRSPSGTHGQEREKDVFDSGQSPLVPRVTVNLIRISRKRI